MDEFDSHMDRLWYLAVSDGELPLDEGFPAEASTQIDEECSVCDCTKTELVVEVTTSAEDREAETKTEFVHTCCFADYLQRDVSYSNKQLRKVSSADETLDDSEPREVPESIQQRVKASD